MSPNWNDLKYVLDLMRHRQIAAVAKIHATDPTTVSRHIKSLEKQLGVKLFQRIDGYYYATDALKLALPQAEMAEQQFKLFESKLMQGDEHLSGVIRVTSVHTFINYYLIERLGSFYQQYPEIRIELIADSKQLDVSRHEVDLAIRMGRPDQASVVTRRLATLNYALYGHQQLVQNQTDPNQLPWIVLNSEYHELPEAIWQQQHFPQIHAKLACNVGPAMFNAVKSGLGIACIPCYMGGSDEHLSRLNEPFSLRELWLLIHQEKRHVARVRVFIDWLESELQRDEGLFRGLISQ